MQLQGSNQDPIGNTDICFRGEAKVGGGRCIQNLIKEAESLGQFEVVFRGTALGCAASTFVQGRMLCLRVLSLDLPTGAFSLSFLQALLVESTI